MSVIWTAGQGLGGLSMDGWSLNNAGYGNAIEVEFGTVLRFGDMSNNVFFAINQDANLHELHGNGRSVYLGNFNLTADRTISWPDKDDTLAGVTDLPTMQNLTASGVGATLSYTFTIPSGKTMSIVQSNDTTQAIVIGSSISGTTLTVELSSVTSGTNNLKFTAFLK